VDSLSTFFRRTHRLLPRFSLSGFNLRRLLNELLPLSVADDRAFIETMRLVGQFLTAKEKYTSALRLFQKWANRISVAVAGTCSNQPLLTGTGFHKRRKCHPVKLDVLLAH
jgi:hypothetical protein